jgi:hypothetical protein
MSDLVVVCNKKSAVGSMGENSKPGADKLIDACRLDGLFCSCAGVRMEPMKRRKFQRKVNMFIYFLKEL